MNKDSVVDDAGEGADQAPEGTKVGPSERWSKVANRTDRRGQGRHASAGAGRRFRRQQQRYLSVLPWKGIEAP